MRVYKFLNAEYGYAAIRENRIKVSRFDRLNDPFDCHSVTFNTAEERADWQSAVQSFGQNRGLTCFAKSIWNPILWSHYAGDHSGLALGIDIADDIPLLEVNYTDKFFDARGFQGFSQPQKRSMVERVLLQKFSQWHYEDEVRAFVDLDHETAENGKHFVSFGHNVRLSEVIVGVRGLPLSDEMREKLRLQSVQVKQAWLSSSAFKVVALEQA